jgi:hypothetical protein
VGAVHGVAGVAEPHDVGVEQFREPIGGLEVPGSGVDAAAHQARHGDVGEVERRGLHEREVARHRELVGGALLGRASGLTGAPARHHRLEVG